MGTMTVAIGETPNDCQGHSKSKLLIFAEPSPGCRGLTLQRCTLAGAGTHLLARSLLLPATGARPRGHGVHQILLLFGSTGDVAHGAWRVLACHAAISRAVCQRLHHVVLIREGSLRPRATSSARGALTELAL